MWFRNPCPFLLWFPFLDFCMIRTASSAPFQGQIKIKFLSFWKFFSFFNFLQWTASIHDLSTRVPRSNMTSSLSYSYWPIKSWENWETSQSGESFTERMKILSLLQIRLILCEELKRNYGNFFSIDALESNEFCKADDKECFDQCREELTYQPQFIDICSKVSSREDLAIDRA